MNRRWVRSQTNRVIGGVAAGLADYLNADPAFVRIAWAVLVPLTGGAAFLAYLVAWAVVPEAPITPYASSSLPPATGDGDAAADAAGPPATYAGPPPAAAPRGDDNRAGLIVGIGLVLVGLWFLLREYLPDLDWSLLWPIALIGIGIVVLVGVSRRRPGG